jgi:hypothetical protein
MSNTEPKSLNPAFRCSLIFATHLNRRYRLARSGPLSDRSLLVRVRRGSTKTAESMLYPGAVVMPDDLRNLSRVCAIICSETGVEPSSGSGQALADHTFRLFMNGLTEERELLGAMRHRYGHNGGQRPNGKGLPARPARISFASPL